ncbi:hypothetical protein BJ508DRAFT_331366 [Ascobolus immersus RN42]|uniref:Uncharacterized protein n=1 Tax=Ascobolus immersus RN42 TaxID=1160509 RepID=A0A3N4HQT1_ASCIM|nr:hypothetical protein BJ508DRAFT_331366 [Ascobolus immersus RN42]
MREQAEKPSKHHPEHEYPSRMRLSSNHRSDEIPIRQTMKEHASANTKHDSGSQPSYPTTRSRAPTVGAKAGRYPLQERIDTAHGQKTTATKEDNMHHTSDNDHNHYGSPPLRSGDYDAYEIVGSEYGQAKNEVASSETVHGRASTSDGARQGRLAAEHRKHKHFAETAHSEFQKQSTTTGSTIYSKASNAEVMPDVEKGYSSRYSDESGEDIDFRKKERRLKENQLKQMKELQCREREKDAAIADLEKQNTILQKKLSEQTSEASRKFYELKREQITLKEQAKKLQEENLNLLGSVHRAQQKLAAQSQEVRALQASEFRATKSTLSESHQEMQGRLEDVFSLVTRWCRSYFRIPTQQMDTLPKEQLDQFAKYLQEAGNTNGIDLVVREGKLGFCFLVEAAINNFLMLHILFNPFQICEPGHKLAFDHLYKRLYKASAEKAGKWRAVTLQQVLSDHGDTLGDVVKEVASELSRRLLSVMEPIAVTIEPGLNHDKFSQECNRFVKDALAISLKLNKKAAGLGYIGKDFFAQWDWLYSGGSEYFRPRIEDEDEVEQPGSVKKVALIVRPGLLKYGNDEGENFRTEAVWMEAVVETVNVISE